MKVVAVIAVVMLVVYRLLLNRKRFVDLYPTKKCNCCGNGCDCKNRDVAIKGSKRVCVCCEEGVSDE